MSGRAAGAFLNLEPLVGAVAGVVFFGNPAGPRQLLGGAAIVARDRAGQPAAAGRPAARRTGPAAIAARGREAASRPGPGS